MSSRTTGEAPVGSFAGAASQHEGPAVQVGFDPVGAVHQLPKYVSKVWFSCTMITTCATPWATAPPSVQTGVEPPVPAAPPVPAPAPPVPAVVLVVVLLVPAPCPPAPADVELPPELELHAASKEARETVTNPSRTCRMDGMVSE